MSPENPSPTPPLSSHPWTALRAVVRRGGRVFGLVLLALVGVLLVKGMMEPYGIFNVDDGFLFAIALVGAGVLLLRGYEPVAETAGTSRSRHPRSPLGILTLSAAFCICGLMILLGNLAIVDIGIPQIAATGLLVVGVGLLVGVWWGRARLLIPIGILLIPVVVVTAFIQFPLRGAVGDRNLTATSIEEVDGDHEILVGSYALNLLEVDDFPERSEMNFEVAAGRVTLLVPQRVGLTITGEIQWGNATIGRGREQGQELRFENELPGAPGAGHLEINFRGGIASLYVERISYRQRFGRTRAAERTEERRAEREAERERLEEKMRDRRREARQQRQREARQQRQGEQRRNGDG